MLFSRKALLFTVLLTSYNAVVVSSGEDETTSSFSCNHESEDPLCIAALNDERTYIKTFNTSIIAPIVVGVGGSTSALSSGLIILFILRSRLGFSTLYHRIMFAMSTGDLFSSIGMAASTLAMPRDMIYTQFQGASLGKAFTCNLQGSFIWFGSTISVLYSAGLALYYLCLIKFKIKEKGMRKCFEPVLHIISILISTEAPIIMWINGRFNPTPLRAYCTAFGYPWHCDITGTNPEDCMLHGKLDSFGLKSRQYHVYLYVIIWFGTFAIIAISMILTVLSVFEQGRILETYINLVHGRRTLSDEATERRLQAVAQRNARCKVVTKVALAYVFSYTLTHGTALLNTGEKGLMAPSTSKISSLRWTLQFLLALMAPLQGFFNAIIFFSQKVYERNVAFSQGIIHDSSAAATPSSPTTPTSPTATTPTTWQTLLKLFKEPEKQRFVISQISLIVRDEEQEESDEEGYGHRRYEFHGEDDEEDEDVPAEDKGELGAKDNFDDDGDFEGLSYEGTGTRSSTSTINGKQKKETKDAQEEEGLSYNNSSAKGFSNFSRESSGKHQSSYDYSAAVSDL